MLLPLLEFQHAIAELEKDYGKAEFDSVNICKAKDHNDRICDTANRMTDSRCRKCNASLRRLWHLKQREVNFRLIMRALGEHGPLTSRQIAEKDGKSTREKDLENRAKIYHRIINGSRTDSVKGLIQKELVEPTDKVLVSRPTSKYRLTPLGVLYFIRLFNSLKKPGSLDSQSARSLFNVDSDPLIESIIKNYEDYFPLIFRNWTSFNEFKMQTSPLDLLSRFEKLPLPLISYLKMVKEAGNNNDMPSLAYDFTLWFYAICFKAMGKLSVLTKLRKDPELCSWLMERFTELEGLLHNESKGLENIISRLNPKIAQPDYSISLETLRERPK